MVLLFRGLEADMSNTNTLNNIGLSLSGGGVRALAFHAGLLKFLAEKNLMGRVTNVSSVSGGSLFTGLVFHYAKNKWAGDTEYLNSVLPQIRKLMTTTSLQKSSMAALIKPSNWKNILNRGAVIAQTIESLWGIKSHLSDLPQAPVWTINGTNGENGRRFRFKIGTMGDYKTGYAAAGSFKTATAMAVSAAFPIGIGPVEIETEKYVWERETGWNTGKTERVYPPYKKMHIYDGGLYDNLGTEAFFDIGRQCIKSSAKNLDYMIVSDAGTPFEDKPIPNPMSFGRAGNLVNILMDQDRSLRVRSFQNFFINNRGSGMYISMSNDLLSAEDLHAAGLTTDEINTARNYPTTLEIMKEKDFDALVKYGCAAAALCVKN
jgi:NTE family protein